MKVGIIGITGYTGQELIRILDRHPVFDIVELGARVKELTPLAAIAPSFRHTSYSVHPVHKPHDIPLAADAYFLALPHCTAMEYACYLSENGKIIIDLSADFRFLQTETYEQYYSKHLYPELNTKAVYGMPEIFRDKIKNASLVANPGCYPTSIILGAHPLAKRGLVTRLLADSKSGVSGAGHNPQPGNVFCSVNENFKAYKINSHRHQPEIADILNHISPCPLNDLIFVPHLVPMNRGIFSTLYISLNEALSTETVREIYREDYAGEPFIRIVSDNKEVETGAVLYSNFCDLKMICSGKTAIVLSAIDNLGKGASSQAIHNLNIIAGIPESTGIQ